MADLDLLVPQRDAARGVDLLKSNGYRLVDPDIGLRFFSDSGEALLKRADGIFDVDLHWRIAPAHFNPLNAAEIRSGLVPIDVAGRTMPGLCPEDLFAYLCLNAAKNEWRSLADLCDLDRLINACRLDWETIVSRAARRRMSRIVFLGLSLAQDLLGSNLPPEVSRSVRADARTATLAASIRTRLNNGRAWSDRERLILRFRLMEGVWAKVRYFWYILQPTLADWEVLHIPESMLPVYYLTRPIRLAWKWCVRPISHNAGSL
jgi:hypothetical protein